MGILDYCRKKIEPSKSLDYKDIPPEYMDLKAIPDDEYLCPYCEKIPEILNIHTDNGKIELKCKEHGIIELTLKEYYNKMKNHSFTYFKTKCFNCDKVQNNKDNMFKYCYYCKADFCEKCVNKFKKNKKEHHRNHLDVCIPVNEKKHKCLEHFNSEISSFCLDCRINICEKESKTKHNGHKKINLNKLEDDANKYIKEIKEKNKVLTHIIRYNNIFINSYENFQNNYFHIQNLINIGKALEGENKRNSKELDIMISGLEKRHKIQEKAIKSLKEQFNIKNINCNEEKLSLSKRNLGDNGFKLISKIIFRNLKEIDVSGNDIKDIEPLNNMILPDLEYLNMSYNKIENIEPIAELNSKKLKEICLQENNINDISSFNNSDFPALEILRLEKNNIDYSGQPFKVLKNKKYKDKVFYEEKTQDDFNKKYNTYIDFTQESIILSNLKGKDKMLLDLYLIIKPDNNIKELKLDDNQIKNVSLISRIPLNELKLLDLSLNNITNVQFLTEMKMPKLSTLYLNVNKINDIYPLIQITEIIKNFPNLYILSLKENNLNIEDEESKRIIKKLWDRGIELDIKLPKEKNN